MKPSERRALLEKKRAEKEAEAQRRAESETWAENESESLVTDDHGDEDCTDKAEEAEIQEQTVKKEGFFSKYSMLIAAVVTSFVVLGGVIFGVDYVRYYYGRYNQHTVYDDGVDISMSEVNILHDNFYDVKWRHLEGFNYTDYSYSKKGGKYILREYPIEGTDLVLRVGGPESQKEPDFIYVRSYEPSEYIDISVDDPRYYFYQRGYTDTEDD